MKTLQKMSPFTKNPQVNRNIISHSDDENSIEVQFHVRKPYFVRLEKLNGAWSETKDPSGIQLKRQVVPLLFSEHLQWLGFWDVFQTSPTNPSEINQAKLPPQKTPNPHPKRDYEPTSSLKAEIKSRLRGSSGAPLRRTLGAVWCRGARCP